ncbi:hypothetical protein ELI02_29805 (plasmid) [Rhizobium leguminosarum]|uniref:hypothetical protein n=1 Tax=Rhizobium TaxID=379 RepID=UPI001030E2F2|nr:hypothetical protein [Rhizobium leguminosarum]TAV48466.1 hypothetical protein ELI32_09670 [Rhizobium leguminosarum]TAV57966.1 hypothetical protein ELI31_09200 [Rhizobium leguminosarum]TAV68907.1 hypothetical protein ELI30_09215 [Rhizobium leguminosarum]TAX45912.1 hypothetical protein ELI02_29805 [Rhizobium leguminosarum]
MRDMQTLEEQKETVSKLRTEIEQAQDFDALKPILQKILDIVSSSLDDDLGGWEAADQPSTTR